VRGFQSVILNYSWNMLRYFTRVHYGTATPPRSGFSRAWHSPPAALITTRKLDASLGVGLSAQVKRDRDSCPRALMW
jgi:hypothetical protein